MDHRSKLFIKLYLLAIDVYRTDRQTDTRLTALFPGLPRWASTRKVKPIWILLKQETVSGSGICWAICKSAPCSRRITMPAPTTEFFTDRMPFLPPNQQRQSTDVCRTCSVFIIEQLVSDRRTLAVWHCTHHSEETLRRHLKTFLFNFLDS